MAHSWQKVRAEAIASGRVDEKRVRSARKALDEAVRAQRLAEIRKSRGLTQAEIAAEMHVTQVRVSRIERGQISRSEVGTLRSYVEALGGKLNVVADFGDQEITVE